MGVKMSEWEDFEKACTSYLNEQFGKYAKFTHKGGSNSTVSDIFVETYNDSFYIDAKLLPSQCGQFVLFPDTVKKSFQYSDNNANLIDEYAEKIIDNMNKNFDLFYNAGTAGKDVIMADGQEVFSKWIIKMYKAKNTRFFITNGYIIPVDRMLEFFEISATYRIKRSGTSSVGKNKISLVRDYVINDCLLKISRTEEDKLFIVSPEKMNNKSFELFGSEYIFSLRDKEYEVRKRGKTNNANVIFSIKHKKNTKGLSKEEFIAYLS